VLIHLENLQRHGTICILSTRAVNTGNMLFCQHFVTLCCNSTARSNIRLSGTRDNWTCTTWFWNRFIIGLCMVEHV